MSEVLLVDGYGYGDRLLEGVMFEVHIEEGEDSLTILSVTPPTSPPSAAEYAAKFNLDSVLAEIREDIEGEITYTLSQCELTGIPLKNLLDLYQKEVPGSGRFDYMVEL